MGCIHKDQCVSRRESVFRTEDVFADGERRLGLPEGQEDVFCMLPLLWTHHGGGGLEEG